jgi:hypothetical protein
MLYKLGRFLQLLGLLLLPVAMAGNATERLDLKSFYWLSGLGVGVFVMGWLLQQSSRPQ